MNAQLAPIEAALTTAGIPYVVRGGRFYERPDVRAAIRAIQQATLTATGGELPAAIQGVFTAFRPWVMIRTDARAGPEERERAADPASCWRSWPSSWSLTPSAAEGRPGSSGFPGRAGPARPFTDKAAAEMGERLRDLGQPGVTARTFHAHALSQLRHFWPDRHAGAPPPEILESKFPIVGRIARALPGGYRFTPARTSRPRSNGPRTGG